MNSLIHEPEQQALSTDTQRADVSIFEKFATDPNVSVEKIERLMALWERGEARKAEAAFFVEMSTAQAEMRSVATDALNPSTRSKYASYEALDRALRPIYTGHGFGLSFNTGDSPLPEHIRVLCLVTHKAGHSREYHIDMPADGKGAKGGDVMTKTHAVGSAASYGMRYLVRMIWNVAVGEGDDDGNSAGRAQAPKAPPKGYDGWLTDLEATSANGTAALRQAWDDSRADYRRYLTETNVAAWEGLKRKAAAVQS